MHLLPNILMKLLIIGLVIAFVPSLLVRAWRRWLARMPTTEPRCRRCGYVICDGAGRICPECGEDLRKVGVVCGVDVRPFYPINPMIGAGLILAAAAIFLSTQIVQFLPAWGCEYAATIVLPSPIPTTRPADLPDLIEITAGGRRHLIHQPPDSLDVVWWTSADDERRWKVEAHQSSRDQHWQLYRAAQRSAVASWPEFDQRAAEQFLESAGLPPDSPQIPQLSSRIIAALQQLQRLDLPPAQEITTHAGRLPALRYYDIKSPRRFLTLAALIWLPTWLLIARHLRSRHHDRLAVTLAHEQQTLHTLHIPASNALEISTSNPKFGQNGA